MSLNKKLFQNIGIMSAVFAFLALSFAPIVESAQTKNPKPTPTPVKKKTTPTPKKTTKTTPTPKLKVSPKTITTPKTTSPKSTPKATPTKSPVAVKEFPQVIVMAASARVRSKAGTSSPELRRVKLGTIIKVLEKGKDDWYKVEIPAKPKNIVGWMSGQVANDYDSAKKEDIYQQIVEKNYKPDMSFVDVTELFDFLTRTQTEVKSQKLMADFGFKRLLTLQSALKSIPSGKGAEKPYKDFLKVNEKSVIYSEPAGEWYARSELFWDLRKKFATAANAEEIAWTGAKNPLAGECEGYVNCYLFIMRETNAKYLEIYPNGKYSLEAIKNIQNLLDPIVADLAEKQVYTGPTDVSDRAEFYRLISEIRTIVSKSMIAEEEKQKLIQQLNQISEAFR